MRVIAEMSRMIGHFVSMAWLHLVICLLGVAGLFIVASSLAETYEDTALTKRMQCAFFGASRPDCPSYERALNDAREAEAEARSAAKELDDRLNEIRSVQNADASFTLFSTHDGPGGWTVTVATQYDSLVPPDLSPSYGCYINLKNGAAGESRNWWFKTHDGRLRDNRTTRQTFAITDVAWSYATKVCKPAVIGSPHG